MQYIQFGQIEPSMEQTSQTQFCGNRFDVGKRRFSRRLYSSNRQILQHETPLSEIPVNSREGHAAACLSLDAADDGLADSFIESGRIEKEEKSHDGRGADEQQKSGRYKKVPLI